MRSLSILLFVFSCFGYAEAPKCDLPTSWAANVASVYLVNDGVFSTEELLHEQTQVTELASENIASDVYHQIHEIEGSDKRIKSGSYRIKPYSSLKYKEVYELKDVPGRTFILMHAGNYHEDTQGCLMPGKTWGVKSDKHYYVGHSRTALKEIFSEISGADEVVINIINEFGD